MDVEVASEIGNLMSHVADQAVWFLSKEIGLTIRPPEEGGSCSRCAIGSSVPISGAVRGSILMSTGEETASVIMSRLLGQDVAPEERPQLLQDTVCEVLNMIVGGTTRVLDEDGLYITVSAPSPAAPGQLRRRNGTSGNDFFRKTIQTESGPIVLIYSGRNGRTREIPKEQAVGY